MDRAVRGVLVMGIAATMLAGCAGRTKTSALSRLQSQVNLLDERVAQLERGSVGTSPSSSIGEADIWTSIQEPASAKRATRTAAPAKATTASTDKPGTREVQQALKNAGFYQGAVDGKMGPMTRQAITEFQRINGLKPDGVAGRQTWTKLKDYADLSGNSAGTSYLK